MDAPRIYLLFFGLPLAILGLGLRRAVGSARMLALVALSAAVGLYGLLAEEVMQRIGHGLPAPLHESWSRAHALLPLCVGAALLGALGVVLVRFRARPPREDPS